MLDRLSGADSQCAETIRIAFGLGSARAQSNSWVIHAGVLEQRRGAVAEVERREGAVLRRPGGVRLGGGDPRRCAAKGWVVGPLTPAIRTTL